jgi:hypothetical protein
MQICIPASAPSSEAHSRANDRPSDMAFASLWKPARSQHSKSVGYSCRIRQRGVTSVLSIIRTTRLYDIINTNQRFVADLSSLRSTLLPRLQRVERELLSASLGRLFAELHVAVHLVVRQGLEAGEAMEKSLRALTAPLPRGKVGGLARARTAWRYFDGTFMPESMKWEAYCEEYERFAKGGRARAASANRLADGTFAPKHLPSPEDNSPS